MHTVHAARLNRDYEIYVALPKSYAKSERRYPVVFVTDAPYAFPLTRAIAERVAADGLPEFILVGLGYAKGDTPEFSRRRDYTPSPALQRPANAYRSDRREDHLTVAPISITRGLMRVLEPRQMPGR